jgi:endonuclease YncB( thermonuclease family)
MNILRLENGDTTTVNMNGRQVKIEIEKIYPPSYRYNELLSKMTD